MMFTDTQIVNGLRRLRGQPCTPLGFDRDLLREITSAGLAKFNEWPSGHWKITERGVNFMAEVSDNG